MPDNRTDRLAADYRDMLKIQDRPYLSWIVTKGEPPCAREYLLDVRIRSYALSSEGDRFFIGAKERWTVKVTLWDSYPVAAPSVRMLDIPPVFHPSWYSKGSYCPSEPWRPDCPLKDFVLRMLSTLRYDPSQIETETPANYKALDWYKKRRGDTALFPSDAAALTENAGANAAAPFESVVDDHPFGLRE